MLKSNEKAVIFDIERSDGEHFVMGTGTNWKIPSDAVAEWNSLDYQNSTAPSVLTDGSKITSSRVGEKDRSLRAEYTGSRTQEERSRAIWFFNPRFTFKAHVTYMGRTRYCEGKQDGFKASTENIYKKPYIEWMLLCGDPYMKDEDGNEKPFGVSVPMRGFPFVSHNKHDKNRPIDHPAGFIVSKLVYDGKNTIYNNGDVECGYHVVITAKGIIDKPMLIKDDKFVKLDASLYENDVCDIIFEDKAARVLINGENAINYTTKDSSFIGMELQRGKNTLSFECENEENRSLAKINVFFHKKYLGV